jgi:RNA polymerase sigma-70 factor, ECF subfamily
MMNHRIFEQTALQHKSIMHAYALHLTMNSENAKDLLQETYLKAYRFWDNCDTGENIKAWLYCIMKNSYINLYRKEKNEPKKIQYEEWHLPYNAIQETSFGQKHFPETTSDEIFGDEIARSIESLKGSFRNIVILSDVEGHTYEEIATIVGCPIGTVRSRLHRSRNQLRKKLFKYAKNNRYILQESCMSDVHERTRCVKNR